MGSYFTCFYIALHRNTLPFPVYEETTTIILTYTAQLWMEMPSFLEYTTSDIAIQAMSKDSSASLLQGSMWSTICIDPGGSMGQQRVQYMAIGMLEGHLLCTTIPTYINSTTMLSDENFLLACYGYNIISCIMLQTHLVVV